MNKDTNKQSFTFNNQVDLNNFDFDIDMESSSSMNNNNNINENNQKKFFQTKIRLEETKNIRSILDEEDELLVEYEKLELLDDRKDINSEEEDELLSYYNIESENSSFCGGN